MKTIVAVILALSATPLAHGAQMKKVKALIMDGPCALPFAVDDFDADHPYATKNKLSGLVDTCGAFVYDAASVDAALSELKNVQASQLQTITNIINQNYKAIIADPQFRQILEQKITEVLQAKGQLK